MKRTGSYNEVVFDNPETILPSVIISPSAEPDEKTIQIASALNIPILYIDESCYEQYPRVERNTDSEWYSYEAFLKEPLCPLQSTESTK